MTTAIPDATLNLNSYLGLNVSKIQPPLPCVVEPMLLNKLYRTDRRPQESELVF